ncbi:MAG: hypothetical protein AB7I04_24730 [Pseudomonadales bacterium]
MDALWQAIEASDVAFQIGATWLFPLLESVHVAALVLMLGSLLMVDLRLLGVAGLAYEADAMAAGMLPWVWLGFAAAVLTGAGMFVSRPSAYAANPAFQVKLVLLGLVGLNLVAHRFRRGHGVGRERLAAAVSLLLWVGVVVAGRWTGHLN